MSLFEGETTLPIRVGGGDDAAAPQLATGSGAEFAALACCACCCCCCCCMATAGLGLAAAAATTVAEGFLPLGAVRLCVLESTPVTSPRRPPPPPCRLLSLLSSSSCFGSLDRGDVSGYPLYCPRPIIRFRRFLSSINPPTTEQTRRMRIPITRPATAPPLIPLPSSVFGSLANVGKLLVERVLVSGLGLRGVVLAG